MSTSQSSLSTARPEPLARAPGRVAVADKVGRRTLHALAGPVPFPSADGLTHLQLRRFAGCPVCNLHLRAFVLRSDEIAAAGIHEVIVFHSSATELERYQPDLPFPIVPDPDRELYRAFGAEHSMSAVLSPRLWRHVPRVLLSVIRRLRQEHQAPRLLPHGGQLGLPADVLIDADGRVSAVRYGKHAYDQWTVDELLAHTRAARPPAADKGGGESSDTTVHPPIRATQTSQEHQ